MVAMSKIFIQNERQENKPLLMAITPALDKDAKMPVIISNSHKNITVPTPNETICTTNRVPLTTYPKFKPGSDKELTVISAYLNIGRFKKGLSEGLYFDSRTYQGWTRPLAYLHNHLVFYTDSTEFAQIITSVRRALPANLTRIVRISKDKMWSFGLWKKIAAIYSDPDYPKFAPNTMVANYSCAMHAKYEVVEDAILKKYTSDFVTWMDVGYFRDLKRKRPFKLVLPPNFSRTTIAFNRLYHIAPSDLKPEEIIKNNMVFVGGGMVIGQSQTFLHFVLDYRHAVHMLLEEELSNTDQQVLYAMYNSDFRSYVRPLVEIQLYVPDIPGDCWFYLGYQCYRELE